MEPGSTKLNEFELALLENLAKQEPALLLHLPKLHVLSRKFTGVGSFTDFESSKVSEQLSDGIITLSALVEMPKLEHGMGAAVICENGKPTCLETFTYGNEHWGGLYEGYSIV